MSVADRCPVIYLTNNGLGEPHVVSQVLAYLERLQRRKVFILTCEKDDRDPEATLEASRRLEGFGGTWWPTPFRRPPLGPWLNAKALARQATRLVRREGPAILHARSYVAAAAARQAAKETGAPWIFDMRGFYLEERIDNGQLRRGSALHRWLVRSEQLLLADADAVVVLSAAARDALSEGRLGVRPADVRVVPCAVDLTAFPPVPRPPQHPPVLAYAGSLGTGYLGQAMGAFAARLHAHAGWRLSIASRQPMDAMVEAARAGGLPDKDIATTTLRPSQVPAFLGRVDAGVLFLRQSLAKVASSPIKVGEYLASGLPVALSPGCGDASDWVEADRVGVVVDPGDDQSLTEGARRLQALVADPSIRDRCRQAALRRLGLADGVATYERLYADLDVANGHRARLRQVHHE